MGISPEITSKSPFREDEFKVFLGRGVCMGGWVGWVGMGSGGVGNFPRISPRFPEHFLEIPENFREIPETST